MTAAFPIRQPGRLRITLFEACSAFTLVTACLHRRVAYATLYTEGSGDFVSSITAPIATGGATVAGWAFFPTEDKRLSRRT